MAGEDLAFLPLQSVYSDFYIIDDYWPDFKPQHLYDALEWYSKQDITLGGKYIIFIGIWV